MPKNNILPYSWYDTPNIHLCSMRDFQEFCNKNKILISEMILLDEKGNLIKNSFFSNLLAYQVIFCVSKK